VSGGDDHFDGAANSLIMAVVSRPGGTPWLLLPGWQQSAAHWTPVARWLAGSRITLHAADLATAAAGCTAPRGALARTEELLGRLLDEPVTAETAIVLGHSAGAALAVLLEAVLPGVRGVIMVEPVASHFGAAPPRGPVPGMPGAPTGSRALRDQYPMATEATLRSIDAAARRLPGSQPVVRSRMQAVGGDARAARVGRALATAHVPVLVVRGQASALLSAEEAQAVAAMAPSGRCATLPGAGHSPHIDRPRATAAQLIAFADEVTDRPPTCAGASCE
jgi:pimeloyl-ACP methyl ester carboxylesterase